jgi:hypothetical protein
MKKEPTKKNPVIQPAPQLPNIPASPDDPFQPIIEPQVITPDPDGFTTPPRPVVSPPPSQKKRNEDEELPTVL